MSKNKLTILLPEENRLLAAAPDLLEACKRGEELLGAICEVICADTPPPHGGECLAIMRAAIAKAEGTP